MAFRNWGVWKNRRRHVANLYEAPGFRDLARTEFRRPISLRDHTWVHALELDGIWYFQRSLNPDPDMSDFETAKCAYIPGMTLTIAESTRIENLGTPDERVLYRADYEDTNYKDWRTPVASRPWYARREFKIESIRPERLQDITLRGIEAEALGIPIDDPDVDPFHEYGKMWTAVHRNRPHRPAALLWHNNPWVWVVSGTPAIRSEDAKNRDRENYVDSKGRLADLLSKKGR